MIKKLEKFYFGVHPVEYEELIYEFSDTIRRKIYRPQYDKVDEVIRSIYNMDFDETSQFKDKILINTIMVTQLARYYWMMGNFDRCSKGYERQYEDMLDICRSIYGYGSDAHDLEYYFRKFARSKILEEFYFPKKDFWYGGGHDPWQYKYAQDVKCLEKNGYAPSELWSVDYSMMRWLEKRMEGFIKDYEDEKFCIIIEKKELTEMKRILKFVKMYAEDGPWMYYDKKSGLTDKEGKPDQKKVDKMWADFGSVIARMWW